MLLTQVFVSFLQATTTTNGMSLSSEASVAQPRPPSRASQHSTMSSSKQQPPPATSSGGGGLESASNSNSRRSSTESGRRTSRDSLGGDNRRGSETSNLHQPVPGTPPNISPRLASSQDCTSKQHSPPSASSKSNKSNGDAVFSFDRGSNGDNGHVSSNGRRLSSSASASSSSPVDPPGEHRL